MSEYIRLTGLNPLQSLAGYTSDNVPQLLGTGCADSNVHRVSESDPYLESQHNRQNDQRKSNRYT